jgi:hypothetical protein
VHLQQQLTWLQSSLRLWETAASEGRGFRSSDLKVTPELQGVPINLHAQVRDTHRTATSQLTYTGRDPGGRADSASVREVVFNTVLLPSMPPADVRGLGLWQPVLLRALLSGACL